MHSYFLVYFLNIQRIHLFMTFKLNCVKIQKHAFLIIYLRYCNYVPNNVIDLKKNNGTFQIYIFNIYIIIDS